MNLYSIRSTSHGYLVAKFDADFNVEATYNVNNGDCDCPAFHNRGKCKHNAMVNLFKSKDRLDSDWFYNNETKTWSQPISDAKDYTVADQKAMQADFDRLVTKDEVVSEANSTQAEITPQAASTVREPIKRRI